MVVVGEAAAQRQGIASERREETASRRTGMQGGEHELARRSRNFSVVRVIIACYCRLINVDGLLRYWNTTDIDVLPLFNTSRPV